MEISKGYVDISMALSYLNSTTNVDFIGLPL